MKAFPCFQILKSGFELEFFIQIGGSLRGWEKSPLISSQKSSLRVIYCSLFFANHTFVEFINTNLILKEDG